MNIFRRYRQGIIAALASLSIGGGVLFTAATFFHQTDQAEKKAQVATHKATKVDHRSQANRRKVNTANRKVRTIEHVLVKEGIAKRGARGQLGPAGAPGRQGAAGLNAVVSVQDRIDIATRICGHTPPCSPAPGVDGHDAHFTDEELHKIADMICGEPAPCAPADGKDARPVVSFGFPLPPDGQHYTCTDPEGDGTYNCVPDSASPLSGLTPTTPPPGP